MRGAFLDMQGFAISALIVFIIVVCPPHVLLAARDVLPLRTETKRHVRDEMNVVMTKIRDTPTAAEDGVGELESALSVVQRRMEPVADLLVLFLNFYHFFRWMLL